MPCVSLPITVLLPHAIMSTWELSTMSAVVMSVVFGPFAGCLLLLCQRRISRCPSTDAWGQCTKSLRASPLRGSKSREAGSRLRG